ncbi:MAG: murein hydrolase activator NlpD [Pasteurellaceae bacterium]|nr:murein hydrolase activator NlpD [Pasteurellaceae bacterium]
MKKSFLFVPVALALLNACTSDTPAPVENVNNGTLSPGIMQPVDNTSSNNTWEPQVQQSAMPTGMNNPVVSQPVANQVSYQQPQVQTPVQPVATAAKTKAKTQTTNVATNSEPAKKVSQNFEIPRNPTTNAPDYSKIDKGFYKGSTYTVRKGDTMFLIAYISGMDVKELAALNNMSEPYSLNVGQTLKVSNHTASAPQTAQTTQLTTQKAVTEQPVVEQKPVEPPVTYTSAANGTQLGSDGTVTGPVKAGVASEASVSGPIHASAASANSTAVQVPVTATAASGGVVATNYGTSSTASAPVRSNFNWAWPTQGRVIQGFSEADGGNKGIDISGSKGQPVYAAAAGRVVYAGNALRGYGNLIIIKHDDDFLSAYAHNDSISVSDQQEVKAGQQIAKMGSTGTNTTKLHFEIRYKGKSVDPTRYLPRR